MKILERYQWHCSTVFFVNCEHISDFVLIADFGQANVCWVHIKKKTTFEGNVEYIMR